MSEVVSVGSLAKAAVLSVCGGAEMKRNGIGEWGVTCKLGTS